MQRNKIANTSKISKLKDSHYHHYYDNVPRPKENLLSKWCQYKKQTNK